MGKKKNIEVVDLTPQQLKEQKEIKAGITKRREPTQEDYLLDNLFTELYNAKIKIVYGPGYAPVYLEDLLEEKGEELTYEQKRFFFNKSIDLLQAQAFAKSFAGKDIESIGKVNYDNVLKGFQVFRDLVDVLLSGDTDEVDYQPNPQALRDLEESMDTEDNEEDYDNEDYDYGDRDEDEELDFEDDEIEERG